MIDLGTELDAYAAQGVEGASDRLAQTRVRHALRDRIAQGRRRMNGLVVAAVALVAIAIATATLATPPDTIDQVQPSPTPTSVADAPRDVLPIVYSPNYLVDMLGKYETSGAVSCQQIPTVPISTEGSPFPDFMAGLPRWIEINRIYGMPNELPAAYPIPLYQGDGSGYNQSLISLPKLYPDDAQVVVALVAGDGSWWGFDATYDVRDVMPFDRPGMYVTLTPEPTCMGGPRAVDGAKIPAGVYAARQMTAPTTGPGVTTIRDLGTVEVVTGLPSIPQLNVTK